MERFGLSELAKQSIEKGVPPAACLPVLALDILAE
jgi:hypothetical protein